MNEQPQVSPAGAAPPDTTTQAKQAELDYKIASVDTYKQAMAVSTTFMNPNVWTQIRSMSKVFFESRALPFAIKNEAQLVMILQAGFEMGLTPVESIHSLYMVNGSVNVWGKAIVKRLRDHGWGIKYKDETPTSCTAIVSKDKETYEETYTYEMAEQSGYTKANDGSPKIGWKLGLNRKLKLRYGVLSIIIKSYIPEVLGAANDITEVAEDAIIQGEVISEEKKTEAAPAQPPVETSSLAEKLAESRKKEQAIGVEVKGDGDVKVTVHDPVKKEKK